MKRTGSLLLLTVLLAAASCFVSGSQKGESKRPFSVTGTVMKLTSDGMTEPATNVPILFFGTEAPASLLTLADGTFRRDDFPPGSFDVEPVDPRFDTYVLPAAPGFASAPTVSPSTTADLPTSVTVPHVEGGALTTDVGTFTAVPRGTGLDVFSVRTAGGVETTNFSPGDTMQILWKSSQSGIDAAQPDMFIRVGTTDTFAGSIPFLQTITNTSTSPLLPATLTISSTTENFSDVDPDPTDTVPFPSRGLIQIRQSSSTPDPDDLNNVTISIPDDAGVLVTKVFELALTLASTIQAGSVRVLIAKDGGGALDLAQTADNLATAINAEAAADGDFNITAAANQSAPGNVIVSTPVGGLPSSAALLEGNDPFDFVVVSGFSGGGGDGTGSGFLFGDQGGTGSVNYVSGAVTITFAAPVPAGESISARWRYIDSPTVRLDFWDEDARRWFSIAAGVTNWTSPAGSTNNFNWTSVPALRQPLPNPFTYIAVTSEAYPNVIRDQFSFAIQISPPTGSEPSASVAATASPATESGTPGTFTITLNPAPGADVTVNYVLGGDARAGFDYVALPGSPVLVPAGSGTADVSVTAMDDFIVGRNRAVTITLAPGADYLVDVASNTATVTITD